MSSLRSWALLSGLALVLSLVSVAQIKETVLYTFGTNGGISDGIGPSSGLTFDAAGDMYGTTALGGGITSALCPDGCGTVFELSPAAGGGWTETVIHSFADGVDGLEPSNGLVLDAQGNLYGTTFGSGSLNCLAPDCGTVFELKPQGGGNWTETILYSFTGIPDGVGPFAPVVFDTSGNLYSTTESGGINGYGTIFELSPPAMPGGGWTENVLYNFCQIGGPQKCSDGAYPSGPIAIDASGNLYGTTEEGGDKKVWGVVWELSPGLNENWTPRLLYQFDGTSGGWPWGGLTLSSNGSLYGTTRSGGSSGPYCQREIYPLHSVACGGVFRLTPGPKGTWNASSFLFTGRNGANPFAGLVIDDAAAYGTTYNGGAGYGNVFRITNTGATSLYNFCPTGACTDGGGPSAGLAISGGKLYGVAAGGAYGQGVVFSIEP